MPLVPYGNVDFEAEALKLYGSHDRKRLLAEAYQRFPGYHDSQMFDALDYMMDGFEESFSSEYSEGDWQTILEQLAD